MVREAARVAHWPIRFRAVTYSRSTLIGFHRELRAPEGSPVASVSGSPELNRVAVTMSDWDEATVRYFRGRIPADAVQIDVVPGITPPASPS